jgi:hypothetical protein
MHPLTQNLSGLTDKELSDKIADLDTKLTAAYRVGSPVSHQIMMFLEDYRAEHQRRLAMQMEKVLKQSGKTFDDIIDIK